MHCPPEDLGDPCCKTENKVFNNCNFYSDHHKKIFAAQIRRSLFGKGRDPWQ